MAMLGSVVTRNMRANRLYAGNPAEDVTEQFRRTPFRVLSVDEKHARLDAILVEYFTEVAAGADRDRVCVVESFPTEPDPRVTYYNVATREYTKTHQPEEVALNRWMFPSKAKFRPRG
jgi:hypothetical protein